jgi:hypothetical protein
MGVAGNPRQPAERPPAVAPGAATGEFYPNRGVSPPPYPGG